MTQKQTAIVRDLHDGISPTYQAVVDGSLTKEFDRNVQMCVLLDRKESTGSQYSPLYWVERIYQALTARLFSNPQEAYDAIVVQAKGKGLSDSQEKELRKWLAAMGLGVKGAEKDLETRSLADNGGYSVIDYKQRQVQALRTSKKQAAALQFLGSVLARYLADKDKYKAKAKIAALSAKGFSDREIVAACTADSIATKSAVGEILAARSLPRKASKFRVEIEASGVVDTHYVEAESASAAKKAVQDLYEKGSSVLDSEEVSESSIPAQSDIEDNNVEPALRVSRFGTARQLVAQGKSRSACMQAMAAQFPSTNESELKALVTAACSLPTDGKREASSDPFINFYARECSVDEATAMSELRTVEASVRRSMDHDFKLTRTLKARARVLVEPGDKVVFGKSLGRVLAKQDGTGLLRIKAHAIGLPVAAGIFQEQAVNPSSITHIVKRAGTKFKVAYVQGLGFVTAQTPPPPPPTTPVSPGKKRVYDEKQKGWIEMDDRPAV